MPSRLRADFETSQKKLLSTSFDERRAAVSNALFLTTRIFSRVKTLIRMSSSSRTTPSSCLEGRYASTSLSQFRAARRLTGLVPDWIDPLRYDSPTVE